MANVEHRDLTGASLHEPKGVSTATDGQVATAQSGGVQWVDPNALNSVDYGGIGLFNSAGTSVSTIGTTAQKLTVFDTALPSSPNVTADAVTDKDLTLLAAGDYQITFTISFATTAVGDAGTYQFRLRVNGSEGTGSQAIGVHRQMSGSNDTGSASFSGIATFAVNDVLTVWVESDEAGNTDDIDIYEASFFVHRVGG